MVEVVFSNSEKGALRCAQHCTSVAGTSSVMYPAGTRPPRRKMRQALSEANYQREAHKRIDKALGGLQDVLGLPFCLDIGAIDCPVDGSSRRELITRMYAPDPFGEQEDMTESVAQFWGECLEDRDALLERSNAGEPVRVWYSDAPYSLCGLYSMLSMLRKAACTVTAIKLPRWMPLDENTVQSASSWGEIEPGRFACYLPLEREIPRPVRLFIAAHWVRLQRENAPLRVVINGELRSAGVDFYDPWIRMEIPDEPIQTAKLIGLVLGKYRLGIGDWLVAERIRHMLDTGELKAAQDDKAFYKTMLLKS